MVADVDAVTLTVPIENVALVAPAGTVTLAGTVAAVALLARDTTAPPVGAAEVSVTVPVEAVPPVTLAGLRATALAAGAAAFGVTALDGAEAGPVPTRLVATTWSVTAVPLVRPVTVAEVTLPATFTVPTSAPVPSSALTVYEVIGAPPSDAGGVQVTVAAESPAVAAPIVGAPGTVADGPPHGVGSSGPTAGPMADPVVAPSP